VLKETRLSKTRDGSKLRLVLPPAYTNHSLALKLETSAIPLRSSWLGKRTRAQKDGQENEESQKKQLETSSVAPVPHHVEPEALGHEEIERLLTQAQLSLLTLELFQQVRNTIASLSARNNLDSQKS
jgi:hypothetical protein